MIDDHRAGRNDYGTRIWSLLQLELWFRTYVDASSPTPVALNAP